MFSVFDKLKEALIKCTNGSQESQYRNAVASGPDATMTCIFNCHPTLPRYGTDYIATPRTLIQSFLKFVDLTTLNAGSEHVFQLS